MKKLTSIPRHPSDPFQGKERQDDSFCCARLANLLYHLQCVSGICREEKQVAITFKEDHHHIWIHRSVHRSL